jgi:mannose-6-phosphate isomerase-like protein (cupin superfamily)
MWRNQRGVIVATAVAVLLGTGWATREWGHAQEKAKLLASGTLTADQIKTTEATYEGKPTGKLAVYFDGNTAGTRNFVSGRFELRPGTEPHPPHTHPEEEILIVASGTGEIFCDSKTTEVGPGAIMYTGPNVSHSIKNTGTEPLVFYWVKWIGVTPR